jgi:hypothetical protein
MQVQGQLGAIRAKERMIPATQQARKVAAHRLFDARVWGAPRLEQAAHYVETELGPRVGSLLSKTAHLIEPSRPRRRNRNTALMTMLAAVGAVGAVGAVMSRRSSMNTLSHPDDVMEPGSMVTDPATDGQSRPR